MGVPELTTAQAAAPTPSATTVAPKAIAVRLEISPPWLGPRVAVQVAAQPALNGEPTLRPLRLDRKLRVGIGPQGLAARHVAPGRLARTRDTLYV